MTFCHFCGEQQPEDSTRRYCPEHVAIARGKKAMFCGDCGIKLPGDAPNSKKFCDACAESRIRERDRAYKKAKYSETKDDLAMTKAERTREQAILARFAAQQARRAAFEARGASTYRADSLLAAEAIESANVALNRENCLTGAAGPHCNAAGTAARAE